MGVANDVEFLTYEEQGVYVHRAAVTVCGLPVYAEIESHSLYLTNDDRDSLMESIYRAIASFNEGVDTIQ